MINDNENKQFIIPMSLWYWQWDAPEIWCKAEENKTYNITTYGYRIPMLCIYPNIIKIQKDDKIDLPNIQKDDVIFANNINFSKVNVSKTNVIKNEIVKERKTE